MKTLALIIFSCLAFGAVEADAAVCHYHCRVKPAHTAICGGGCHHCCKIKSKYSITKCNGKTKCFKKKTKITRHRVKVKCHRISCRRMR